MWEEYEITPNNALQYRKEELTDRQAIKADVTRIKDEIRKLGSVNVNAIEDYKELLERHTFLSGQYDDIVKAEETLEGIILELDEGMRKQFTEKFRDIQREFDKAFKELFGGVKGTLELAEDEDILEAGIPKYDAAFWWRKSFDCDRSSFCNPEPETISILSSG